MDEQAPATKKPMTSAEKMRRLRAKRKQQDPDFSSKESQRVEALRKKRSQEMTKRQMTAYRKAAAARKQKSRENKLRTELSEAAQKAYKSPQSLGSATNKTEKLLPRSPRKKEVISNLAKKVFANFMSNSV